MAEYKQYITQIQENGNVMISEDVVAAIVANALAEVDGIGLKRGMGSNSLTTRRERFPLQKRSSVATK